MLFEIECIKGYNYELGRPKPVILKRLLVNPHRISAVYQDDYYPLIVLDNGLTYAINLTFDQLKEIIYANA